MNNRRSFAVALALMLLAGCAGTWEVAYDDPPGSDVTKDWRVVDVVTVVPDTLTVSNDNTFAPKPISSGMVNRSETAVHKWRQFSTKA